MPAKKQEIPENGNPEPAPKKKKSYLTHANRLLRVLAEITSDDNSTVTEKLQAVRLSLDAMDRRKTPKRKTDREKLIEKALGGKKTKPVIDLEI